MLKYSIIIILCFIALQQCNIPDVACPPPCEKLAEGLYFHNNQRYVLKNRLFFGRQMTYDTETTNNPYTYHKIADTNIVFCINEQSRKRIIYITLKDTSAFSYYVLKHNYQRTMYRNIRYEMEGKDTVFVAESINFGEYGDGENRKSDSLYHYFYRRSKLITPNHKYYLTYKVAHDTVFDTRPYQAEARAIWDCIEVKRE